MFSVRLFFGVVMWLLYLVCFVPLVLLGWILVPVAAACGAYKTVNGGAIYHFTWPFMYIWDNFEDGIANNSYSGYSNMFMRIVSWSCNRNPVNNLRTLTGTPFSCLIKSRLVEFVGSLGNSDDVDRRLVGTSAKNIWESRVRLYDTPLPNLLPQWFIAWQGLYLCWYWAFKMRGGFYRVIIGYNIYPTFIWGVTPAYENGSGFSITFKKIA